MTEKLRGERAVHILDLFTKNFCIKNYNELEFMCKECPFGEKNGICRVKVFKSKYAPKYEDFGAMGDL